MNLTKIVKIVGIIVAAIVLLLAIGIFLLVHFVDPNKFKSTIIDTVNEKTGRHLTISGDLSWSFFPWIGFEINGVSLSNAQGFGTQPFAQVKHLGLKVAVLPLLSGNIEIRNVEVDGLALNLARNSAGTFNWDDIVKKMNADAKAAPAKPQEDTKKTDSTLDFSISNLTVVHGNLSWQDGKTGQNYNLKNLYINGSNVGTEQIFPLTVSFTVDGSAFAQPLNISLNGNFNIDDQLNSFAVNSADFKVNDFEIEGDFSASRQDSKLRYQGDLQIGPFNAVDLAALFKVQLPKMAGDRALHKVGSDLAFNGDENSITINPINITIDSTNINGNASVKNFAAPRINFKLTSNQLNLDNYLAPPVKGKKADSSSQNTSGEYYSTEKINLPIELLRSLTLDGTFTMSELVVKNLHLKDISATVTGSGGVLKMAPFKMNLYDGSAVANASMDVAGYTPRYAFDATVTKVQGGGLIKDFTGGADFIEGTANFDLNINTTGDNVKALVASLNGNSRFGFTNGVLKGINIGYQLDRAQALMNKKAPPSEPSDHSTPFGHVTGTIQITGGVANNNDLLIDNDLFVGNGKGTANLNNQQINYLLNIQTKQKGSSLQGYQIPLTIKGSFNSPSIGLDVESIMQQALRNQAKKAAEQNLKKQVGGLSDNKNVQNALNNLFG